MNALASLSRSLSINGLTGTLRLAFQRLLYLGLKDAPPAEDPGLAFDREHGTDTCGHIIPEARSVIGRNWRHGQRYEGIPPDVFRRIIGALGINCAEWSFVDLGSGKGRALILAKDIGFDLIVGVEYSDELCRVAENNLCALKIPARRVYVNCADAATFTAWPNGNLVVFLYNPFGPALMEKVAENLARRRGPALVVYANPLFPEAWQAQTWLTPVACEGNVKVWRTALAAGL